MGGDLCALLPGHHQLEMDARRWDACVMVGFVIICGAETNGVRLRTSHCHTFLQHFSPGFEWQLQLMH